ncbi:hypothetical protein Taro_005384 [Colocasia esculenta]|uniref:Uncharacterized protein n=1 Tax=Colocasia esculenta TaxID=4460 RepID=A0A843TKT0_COLES|nr:hypothetical protein [Colocasia esculenta]
MDRCLDAGIGNGVASRATVFINEVAFEVGSGLLNVREAFGEEAVLLHSSGHPVPVDERGVTFHPLQNGAFYYLAQTAELARPMVNLTCLRAVLGHQCSSNRAQASEDRVTYGPRTASLHVLGDAHLSNAPSSPCGQCALGLPSPQQATCSDRPSRPSEEAIGFN